MNTPILFLDFDGVLNHGGTRTIFHFPDGGRFTGLDRENVERLNHLVEEMPEIQIVVSSTWRTSLDLNGLRDALTQYGFKYPDRVIDVTPIQGVKRGHEIQAWLDAHGSPAPIAILDDCSDMAHLMPRLVQTDMWNGGLSSVDVSAVVALLSEAA